MSITQIVASSRKQCVASVDSGFSHVTITDLSDSDNEVFLQGAEADNFIEQCRELYDQGELSYQDCVYFHAYDYLHLFCD